MAAFDPEEMPHRRFNPLTGQHVLVSPHRMKRPWNGQVEDSQPVTLPQHDPKCYLCPGNERMGEERNPEYENTFVFPNDYPAVLPSALPNLATKPATHDPVQELFACEPVRGRCSVMCFHPRHDLTLARMSVSEIEVVVRTWCEICETEGRFLRKGGGGGYVQIFENRGAMMGASAPHPHGQVWTTSYVPEEVATELANLSAYAASNSASGEAPCRPDGRPCLLCTYAHAEVERGERVVALDEEGGWVALVPFWAVWPFETLVLPYRRHIAGLTEMTAIERASLARVLKGLLVRYDNLFNCAFPYSMGVHQAPFDTTGMEPDSKGGRGEEEKAAHIHLHFYPPLLRSASVRKFLVGFEMLGEPQRDLTPEAAARRLRELSSTHYLEAESGERVTRTENGASEVQDE